MDYPDDVISLRRCADIIEGYFSLSPEYRELILTKLGIPVKGIMEHLNSIKAEYISNDRRDKIKAIKDVRVLYTDSLGHITMGLREAKELVESW